MSNAQTSVAIGGPLFDLTGSTALVSGASTAVGREIALRLAEYGADVAVSARQVDKLQPVADAIAALGRRSAVVPLDLTDSAAIDRAVSDVLGELGRLDIVVNAAGATYHGFGGDAVDLPEELWDRHLNVNLKATFLLSRAAARHMLASGGGKIVNIASTLSFIGYPGGSAYCASKGGVVQLTRALAVEWAKHGINVNAIAPGAMRTEVTAAGLDDPHVQRAAIAKVPAGRLVRVADVAAAAVFLSSAAADMVHGHTLVVDGGTIII